VTAPFPGEPENRVDALIRSYIAAPTGSKLSAITLTKAPSTCPKPFNSRKFRNKVCLYLKAVCALIAIALVHSDNRHAPILSVLLFATGVATAALLIAAHDRRFICEISVSPDPLLQVYAVVKGGEKVCRTPGSLILASKYLPSCAI
jgi:hypothetical protein